MGNFKLLLTMFYYTLIIFSMNQKTFLIIIIVLLIGVVAFFALKGRDNDNEANENTKTTVMSPTSAPAMSPAPSPEATGGAAMKAVDSTMPGEMTVTLATENNSGEKGTATLKEVAGKTVVTVDLTGAPAEAQPAHIHVGNCPAVGAIAYNLTNVVGGKSITTLDATLAEIKAKLPLGLNVHKSVADIKTYVACGDLK
jgi:hypothetical protein